jgi:hypothetical protein
MTEPIKQPEALRLADELDDLNAGRNYDTPLTEAAAELRRLHGEVDALTDLSAKGTKLMYECADLRAEVEKLREDAERYRWLRECARATSEHWGGRWSLVTEGTAPKTATPAGIDAAIDAARDALKEPK